MRVAPAIKLTDVERKTLKSIAGSPRQPMRLVRRANIVLMAERGMENVEIAQKLHVSVALVGRWRRRYAASNFAGFEKDKTRSPGKPKTPPALIQTIVDKTMQEKPSAQTHWSQHSMAEVVGVSPSTIGRIWAAHGLKPHLIETFKLSNDPLFAEKLEDIVGLYINPPEHAVVLCADEKAESRPSIAPSQGYRLNPVAPAR